MPATQEAVEVAEAPTLNILLNPVGKTKRVYLPSLGRIASLLDREAMRVGHPVESLRKPSTVLPKPTLPFDWAKALSFPIDGNDIYGDCMMAAAEHADNTFTGDNGTESSFNQSLTVSTYLALSGGNNGLNSGQIISAWEGGLPGVPTAKIMDALNIDTTDAELVQTAMWLFGGLFFTLAIPDTWYNNFSTGGTWDSPATADSNNGHGVWWNGVDANGHYRMETWGTYGWITPGGVKVCDPGGFVAFSTRWFNSTGKAPNGYTYNQLAAYWKDMGGKALPVWPNTPAQSDRLLAGQGLFPGNAIHSADGRFRFLMQTDGNLVLYGPAGQPLWSSGTHGHNNVFDVIMQSDGNLVIYAGQNQALWSSGTQGKAGAHLIVQNDGNAVMYDGSNHAVWATNTVVPATPGVPGQVGRLLAGQGLLVNGSIHSADGRFTLRLQGDGNLVLAGPGNQILWASGSSGHTNVWDAVMQADGNLVVYDAHSKAIWSSGTQGKAGATLTVQNDGNVVIYDSGNHAVWASNTVVPAQPNTPKQGNRLAAGEGLIPGHAVLSPDGRFRLILQADGNLVLYGPGNTALYATGTAGHGNVWDAIMQSDGNFVIYDGHSKALWASGTQGKPGTTLTVQNDGNVVLYNTAGQAVWSSGTVVPATPATPATPGRLLAGQGLLAGQSIHSSDNRFQFIMQADGNLVLYDPYNQALWASGTAGHHNVWDVIMQSDGNLVVYDAHGHAIWASNTACKPGATLTAQTDGNVVIYDTGGKALWATNTEVGVEILKG